MCCIKKDIEIQKLNKRIIIFQNKYEILQKKLYKLKIKIDELNNINEDTNKYNIFKFSQYNNNDSFTMEKLKIYLDSYIYIDNNIKLINEGLYNKKCRRLNFPSEISENIVKFILINNYNKKCTWDTKSGDLLFDNKYKIEVKCFSSDGPISFGPEENWDIIYFLDSKQFHKDTYVLYELNLKNTAEEWKNLKVSTTQSFHQQCIEKRRPRILFNKIFYNFKNKFTMDR